MPPKTRKKQGRRNAPTMAAFNPDPFMIHLLQVIGYDYATNPDHPVFQALAHGGYEYPSDLFNLNEAETQKMVYVDSSFTPPVSTTLSRGYQIRLLALKAFRDEFETGNQRVMTMNDWMNQVTQAEMNEFIMQGKVLSASTAPGSGTVSTVTHTMPKPNQAVEAFRKTIRRDPSQFSTFSDKRLWASWRLGFEATARAQDLNELINPTYKPSNPDEKAVFEAKQQYLYAVFVQHLLTDEGKTLVRQHTTDYDAQCIYKDLVEFHSHSMHSEIVGNTILQFLTTFRLGINPWKGKTTLSFLTYYLEQLRLYDEIQRSSNSSAMNDAFKITVLDQAVQSIPDLRQVRITYNTLCLQLKSAGTFNGYFELLQKAALAYDSQQTSRVRQSTESNRKVYATALTHDAYEVFGETYDASLDDPVAYTHDDFGIDDSFGGDEEVDIDTPLSTINVYATQQRRPVRPGMGSSMVTKSVPMDPALRLPDSVFSKLSLDDKRAWFKLGPDARRLILSFGNSAPARNMSLTSPPTGLSSVDRRVHLAETTTAPTSSSENYHVSTDNEPRPSETMDPRHQPRPSPTAGDIRRLLSSSSATGPNSTLRINNTVTYRVAKSVVKMSTPGALIDRGANGGLAGSDCRVIAHNPDLFVNVEGIDRHQLTKIPIVSCGAYSVTRNHGPVILIFHQLAALQKGHTILSAAQLEAYFNTVNEKSLRFDPKGQLITTNDGFELPLNIRNGLAYLDMRPYTDAEWNTLPHVVMTSDVDWDPTILDGEFPASPTSDDNEVLDATTYDNQTAFDAFGNYRYGTIVASAHVLRDYPVIAQVLLPDKDPYGDDLEEHDVAANRYSYLDHDSFETVPASDVSIPPLASPVSRGTITASPHVIPATFDPAKLRQFFAFLPTSVVEKTLRNTTQFARVQMTDTFKRFYKSPFPALNVARRSEDLLTDIIYADTPAIDDGSTCATVYSGRSSHVLDVFGMKSDAQFVNTLEDIIRERGAPQRLLSDSAITLRSARVKEILRALYIGQWTSEPHRQNQNVMERRYQTAKRLTNLLLDRTGAPPSCWLLCLQYVCNVLNCTASPSLGWKIPLSILLGVTVDVSPLLRFYWFQPVFYAIDDAGFPSDSKEALGRFVGISTNCGHTMTFKVLTDDTNRVIVRSLVRPADDPLRPNLRLLDLFDGEKSDSKIVVRSKFDSLDPLDQPTLDSSTGEVEQVNQPQMVPIETDVLADTSDLIGRTFLMEGRDAGTVHRARIVERLPADDPNDTMDLGKLKFKLSVNNDEYESTMEYGEILNHINRDSEQEVLWKFKKIAGHQGPLTKDDKEYRGSSWNVLVEWENGEISYESLNVIANEDPAACAIYARDNGLLGVPGWKRFKQMAKRARVL